MISLYSGTPGSGKSVHAAREIRERLIYEKSYTIGNFDINRSSLKRSKGVFLYVSNARLTPERLVQFSRRLSAHLGRRLKEGEILLVIDEAQLLFNAREWQNLARTGWLSFFSQHRKYGFDILLIAQFDRMLDRQVRSLLEYNTIHRKVSNAGKFGKFLGKLTRGNLFIMIKFWYPVHEKVAQEFYMGTKKLYTFYDSYTEFKALPAQEKKGRQTNSQKEIQKLLLTNMKKAAALEEKRNTEIKQLPEAAGEM